MSSFYGSLFVLGFNAEKKFQLTHRFVILRGGLYVARKCNRFVSTKAGGGSWFPTLHLKVTKSQHSGSAVKVLSMYSSLVSNSLSIFDEDLFALITIVLCLIVAIKENVIPSFVVFRKFKSMKLRFVKKNFKP